MSAKPLTDLLQLCIHTITTKPWSIETAAQNFSEAGVKGITVWRQALQPFGVRLSAKMIAESGLTCTALCRGGFFTAKGAAARNDAIADTKRALDEAAEIGAPMVVLVLAINTSAVAASRHWAQRRLAAH